MRNLKITCLYRASGLCVLFIYSLLDISCKSSNNNVNINRGQDADTVNQNINSKINESQDVDIYNPLIHGTNSAVFALLHKIEFKLLSPIEMIKSYNIAPMSGEMKEGGFRRMDADGCTAFAYLQSKKNMD